LKDPKVYGNNFKDEKMALSKQSVRQIASTASNLTNCAAKIKELAGVKASFSAYGQKCRAPEASKNQEKSPFA